MHMGSLFKPLSSTPQSCSSPPLCSAFRRHFVLWLCSDSSKHQRGRGRPACAPNSPHPTLNRQMSEESEIYLLRTEKRYFVLNVGREDLHQVVREAEQRLTERPSLFE
ncbi:hypothetical protein GOODEAATRI_030876, partial [Goodea atripinnis]